MSKITNIFKAFLGFFLYLFISYFLSGLFKNVVINGNYYTKTFIYILIEFITLLALCLINYKKLKEDFIDFDKNYGKYLKIGFKSWGIGLGVMLISNYIINVYILNGMAYNETVDRLVISIYPLYSVFGIILFGPFIEELAFRYGFKRFINNKFAYYLITVLLFAGMHALNGISNPLELLYFIPYGALAFSFAYTLDKTNNIFTSTVVHTFHNLIAVLLIIFSMSLGV